MRVSLAVAPAVEPISVSRARRHVGQVTAHDDDLLGGYIQAARERCEAITGRQLITADWDLADDVVPCDVLILPKPPLQSIVSIKYLDADGDEQTWSSSEYQVDAPGGPYAPFGRVKPQPSASWPAASTGHLNALTVRFRAGYGDAAGAVPSAIQQAMLLMIGAWYENREDILVGVQASPLPIGAMALLTPYKVFR